MKCKEADKHLPHHPHFLLSQYWPEYRSFFLLELPHSLRSKHPIFICTTSYTHGTCRRNTHGELSCPRTRPQPPLSCPLCPYLGPRAGGSPPRSWSRNLMFRSVNWGVLISQSKTRAELLSQTWKGRSSLGNHMQIPCWGQWCGQSQEAGGRVKLAGEVKLLCV